MARDVATGEFVVYSVGAAVNNNLKKAIEYLKKALGRNQGLM